MVNVKMTQENNGQVSELVTTTDYQEVKKLNDALEADGKLRQSLSIATGFVSKFHSWRYFKIVQIIVYFFLWFTLSVFCNIFVKEAMLKIKLPWMIATCQMGGGIPIFLLLWLTRLRKTPTMSMPEFVRIFPLGVFHCATHVCGCLAIYAGSISFTHIIKAAEPFFTVILMYLIFHEVLCWKVYATLFPVVCGVMMASLTDSTFGFLAFFLAMGANLTSSLRAVYSKHRMSEPIGQNVDARNLYGILTLIAFSMLVPVALIIEGAVLRERWEEAMIDTSAWYVLSRVFLASVTFYLYNEVAFSTLELVSPVTHSVGNTTKRIFVIGSSIIRFGNYPSALGFIGITIGISGVGVYSYMKQKYKHLERKKGDSAKVSLSFSEDVSIQKV